MGAIQITELKKLSYQETASTLALCKDNKSSTTKTKKVNNEHRDSILIRLFFYTGARGCELLKLTPKDFSDRGAVTIKGAKGSNDRTIPLTSDDYLFPTEVREYIKSRNIQPTERIFKISSRRLRQIWDFWRPNSHKGIHSIRHTVGVQLFLNCKNIHVVKTVLGHKSLTSTQVYLDYVESQRSLGKDMKGFLKKDFENE